MRSKILLSVLAIVALAFSAGCGGGGGGGSSTPTTYTVTGTVDGPDTIASGWGSVRAAIPTGLKAQALGKDGTAKSETVSVTNGAFTLTVTPDADVLIKVSNDSGFDFRFNIGALGSNQTITVNASSTARALLTWQQTNKPSLSDAVIAQIVNAIINALKAAPEANKSFVDLVKALFNFDELKSTLQTEYAAINTNNHKVEENLLTLASMSEALNYISHSLHSTTVPAPQNYGYDDFCSVMESRYEKYTINTYGFTIKDIKFTSDTTASVTVSLSANATDKGSGSMKSYSADSKIVGWAKESGTWKIIQDLPYRADEFDF